MKYLTTAFCFFIILATRAQDTRDTTKVLQEVVISAYQYNRPILEVPASIGFVSEPELLRFNNSSLLPVVNTIPGVRMEERSPGSYRFSIRGSLLRSPFGIRNVKMYWNGLPLTDGGGNTYLNLIDLSALGSIEVLKGPGGSLYGAGTGGVVLLKSPEQAETEIQVGSVIGSYGLQRYQLSGGINKNNVAASLRYTHQEADGYREQTEMKRDAANLDLLFTINSKSTLSTSIFYTDLFYETPGGLTKAQFEEDPKQARPAAGPFRSAVEQQASVRNKTVYGSVMHHYQWNERWSTHAGVYSSYSDFENFAIANYERRYETNTGGRFENQFVWKMEDWKIKWIAGAEYQYFFSPVNVYNNNFGTQGPQQLDDDLTSRQLLLFSQLEFDLPQNFFVTLGGSGTFLKYKFVRNFDPTTRETRQFDPVFSPRLAMLSRVLPTLSVYGSISKGFSPPTLAEVRPSTGVLDNDLNPESGTNIEVGVRGSAFRNHLSLDITGYWFKLDETIVIQRDQSGLEYFVNAGKTKQNGLEALLSWKTSIRDGFISNYKIWTSYTYNDFRFDEYVNRGEDYSGNKLTGVPPTVAVVGLDINTSFGFYTNITATYNDHIPLNDANDEFAKEFTLLNIRLGYRSTISNKLLLEFFGGIDNALDERYSLGNDLNAAGRRYYNTAAPRNFYIGFKAQSLFGKE